MAMNPCGSLVEQWNEVVKRYDHCSITSVDPLDQLGVSGLSVEWIPMVGYDRTYICLYEQGGKGRVLRKEYNFRKKDGALISVPLWEGELTCRIEFVRSELRALAGLGLWSLEDYRPDEELLDGEWYILRAKDHVAGKSRSAGLFCPDTASDRQVRNIGRRIEKLLRMSPRGFKFKSWFSYMVGWIHF